MKKNLYKVYPRNFANEFDLIMLTKKEAKKYDNCYEKEKSEMQKEVTIYSEILIQIMNQTIIVSLKMKNMN